MRYTETTPSYNDRRYGRPWMAVVGTSLSKDFEFLQWDGQPGCAGAFTFDAVPGTLLAYGQRDTRKGRGGVDGYQLAMPDGSLPTVAYAAELRPLPLEARWRLVAERKLAWAVTPPTSKYEWDEWVRLRHRMAARYSAMLGVPNPVLAACAKALGLVDAPVVAAPVIDVTGFGL
jgi:hypothetical protein